MKTVNLDLVGIDGNAFSIMGAFRSQAKREGWDAGEIKVVLDEAMDGDYNHLLATISSYCLPEEDETEDTNECIYCDGAGYEYWDEDDGDECTECNGTGYVNW